MENLTRCKIVTPENLTKIDTPKFQSTRSSVGDDLKIENRYTLAIVWRINHKIWHDVCEIWYT